MAKNIIVVTNEEGIMDRIFKPLYGKYPNNIAASKNVSTTALAKNFYGKWMAIDSVNGEYIMGCPHKNVLPSGYQVIKMPFAGFAYMIAYSRKYNLEEDQNLVISIKEKIPTQTYSLELYHLFINSGVRVSLNMFDEYFNMTEGNSLLGLLFDPVMEMIANDQIPMVSPDIKNLLS
jgi:hypothetical protein